MPANIEQYNILFKSLGTGVHNFSLSLDSPFFRHFENPDCPGGAFKVDVEMGEKSHLLSLSFLISGFARVICDRCLDEFDMPLEFETKLFIRFGEAGEDETDADVIYLDLNENKLNLAEYLYESVCLNLPVKKVHPRDARGKETCNSEMIEKLERHRANNNKNGNDPRWDLLRDIDK
jgi:uncharacterized protein